jgi:hypothetical protein
MVKKIHKDLKEYLKEIDALIDLKKYQEAQDLIKDASKIYGDNDILYVKQGHIYSQLGKIKLAIRSFEKALSLNYEQSPWVLKTLSAFTDRENLVSKKRIGDNFYYRGYIIQAVENYVKYITNLSFTKKKPEPNVLNNLILGIFYIIRSNQENKLSFNLREFTKNYLVSQEQYLSFYCLSDKNFLWLGQTSFFYKLQKLNHINDKIFDSCDQNKTKIFYCLNINFPPSKIHNTYQILNSIPKGIVELLKIGEAFLVLDSSSERHRFNSQYYQSIYKIQNSLNIKANQIFYLTQNLNFIKDFETWHKQEKSEETKPNLINFNRAIIDILSEQKNTNDFSTLFYAASTKTKDKKFLCLNNVPRPQRAYVFYWLLKNDLLKEGLVSFNHSLDDPTLIGHNTFKDKGYLSKFFPTLTAEQLSNLYQEINSYLPIYLDLKDRSKLTVNGRGNYVRELPTDLFERTYFSIITESDFNNHTLGFTEKLLKPLLCYHPFIVIGEPGILQLLKDLGFKTFSDFIDESYDQEQDGLTRINMALNEVNKLCQYSYIELDSWYQKITPILQHNFEHFTQNILTNSLKEFEDKFLN